MAAEYVHTCECGRRWAVRKIKTIMRDNDSADCSCRLEIIHWNGGCMYRVTEIESEAKPDSPPTANSSNV